MSAIFDGSATYLLRSSALKDVAASKSGTIAFWFKTSTASSACILQAATVASQSRMRINVSSAGVEMNLLTADLDLSWKASTDTDPTDGNWHHLAAAWDLANTNALLYLDGLVDQTDTTGPQDESIPWEDVTQISIGATVNGATFFNGKIYDLIFWPGTFVDLSDATELRKLVSSDGTSIAASDPFGAGEHIATIPSGVKPVGYGHDASFPTGVAPAVYFSNDWRINRGTGGPFTVVGDFGTESSPDNPNPYRLASRGGKVGERWFDSEKSGMSAPRGETFIERRPGHPDFGKRLRTKDERDEDTRDLSPHDRAFVSLLNPREDDSREGPR